MSSVHFESVFNELSADQIHADALSRQEDGWRYVQLLAVNEDESVKLVYSYMKDGVLDNIVVKGTPHGGNVSSISDIFFEAFVCENEIHDLFDITFDGLVLDFVGNFYKLSTEKPMTIISPEQLAEREKQRKIAAAKAAKEAKEAAAKQADAEAGSSNVEGEGE